MPWEKELYVDMLISFLKEEEKRMKEQQQIVAKLVPYKQVKRNRSKSVKGALKTSVNTNIFAANQSW